ncbi:MAG: hypothetical protein ACOH5I_25615 [Oligoflexus sp.]
MDPVLQQTIRRLMQMRLINGILIGIIRTVRAVLLALIILYTWSALRPEAQAEQLFLSILVFLLGLFVGSKTLPKQIELSSFLKALEIKYPQCAVTAFQLKSANPKNRAWYPFLEKEKQSFLEFEQQRLLYKASTLLLPAIFCLLATQASPGAIGSAFYGVKKVVAQLSRGTSLHIIEGIAEEGQEKEYKLSSSKPLELTLLEQNMVEIRVNGGSDDAPYVRVVPLSGEMSQSFRLTPSSMVDAREQGWTYNVSFAVPENSDIFVSTISANEPAARITVQRLPVPIVDLQVATDMRDPWPDDRPLPLMIFAKAEHPLQLIRLIIRADGQTHEELVNNILSQELTEVVSDYSLLLETYVRQDLSEVEIIAEAIDRHLPTPLVGRSRPLVIRTASAYGRYQETLRSFREIKSILDEAMTSQSDELGEEIGELSSKAIEQSEESPFFDGLDRHIMRTMDLSFQQLAESFDREELLKTSEELNRFLFEHESLDDRERDRDFFVAARSLSRVIEQSPKDRSIPVDIVTKRMESFLDERHQRWEVRNKFLEDDAPAMWKDVQNKPFHKAINDINELVNQNQEEKALQRLSQSVSDYRDWIEKLEEAEEGKRKQMEEQRQQGLADARNQMRELQQRQARVSQRLDQSATRSQQELKDQWGSTRMDQNANIEQTRSMEAQLRSLSPLAAERVKAASQSMELAVQAGNQEAFVQAESAADLAGRLLRQADSAARQSQQQRQGRGRRRRVTSDQYYGSPVAGGDVEIRREYQVNPRYREEILDQVRRARQGGEQDDRLLESYLRQVIR